MRFTSLIVELIRARPRLTIWVVLLVQAAIWLAIPTLFYGSPPGDLALVIALGREYQVGTHLGPPLAFWLADLAFRAAGHHMLGVYLLAQLCFLATFWLLFALGRAVVGAPHAVVAVLLTMTVTAFTWSGVEFGPNVLAQPVWAFTLLQGWRVIGQNRSSGWFGLAIASGLLLLTTADAPWLLLMLAAFILFAARGRRRLASLDPLFALLILLVLALPWLIWLKRTGGLDWTLAALRTPLASLAWQDAQRVGIRALASMSLLALTAAGIVTLAVMNAARMAARRESPPVILRAGVDPLARRFVYTFAIAPAVLGCLLAALMGRSDVVGGEGVALLLVGLAVVIATGDAIPLRRQKLLRQVWALLIAIPVAAALAMLLVVPLLTRLARPTATPAAEVARFFGDNFQRRTGQKLQAVAGDPSLAALVGLGPTRPHLFMDAAPERSPWFAPARFVETGGVVVWRATDTAGAPPDDMMQRFPGLVPEVPHAFESPLAGRQSAVRIGWAIVRPRQGS